MADDHDLMPVLARAKIRNTGTWVNVNVNYN